MTKVGKVSSLFYTPPSGRTRIDTLDFDCKGIVNDKHYNKNIDRTVLIASLESYALANSHDIEIVHGFLGENILIDYNPYHLITGARVQIGKVTFEISQPCTLCKSLTKIDSKLPTLLKDDRGIFAKVVEAGNIKEGDEIYLLD
jgi:MOSC domain-containing protein YiiM